MGDRLDGVIAGLGSDSGRRFVVGRRPGRPFGAGADVIAGRAQLAGSSSSITKSMPASLRCSGVIAAGAPVNGS